MAKVFETENKHYSYGVKDNYNVKIRRVSRWIKLDHIYITKKHSLFDYADQYCIEEDGKAPCTVFRFNNRLYALGQFMRLNPPIFFQDETGKSNFLSGYDCTEYYNPLLIEINETGESIRLYEELREKEYKENGGIY